MHLDDNDNDDDDGDDDNNDGDDDNDNDNNDDDDDDDGDLDAFSGDFRFSRSESPRFFSSGSPSTVLLTIQRLFFLLFSIDVVSKLYVFICISLF